MIMNELFLWNGLPTKAVHAFFQLGPLSEIHHCKSPTRREQGLNLHRI